jgi:hypothetical protein
MRDFSFWRSIPRARKIPRLVQARAWVGKLPDDQISVMIFEAMHAPRGDDGFVDFFPIGMEPPQPALLRPQSGTGQSRPKD